METRCCVQATKRMPCDLSCSRVSNTVLVVTPEAEHGGLDIDMNGDEADGANVDNEELQRVYIGVHP